MQVCRRFFAGTLLGLALAISFLAVQPVAAAATTVSFYVFGQSSCPGCVSTLSSITQVQGDANYREAIANVAEYDPSTLAARVKEWDTQGLNTDAVATSISLMPYVVFVSGGFATPVSITVDLNDPTKGIADVKQLIDNARATTDPTAAGPPATAVPLGTAGDTAQANNQQTPTTSSGNGVTIPQGVGNNPAGPKYDSISSIVRNLYNFGIMIAAIVFIVLFLYGGIAYMTAGGDQTGTTKARRLMVDAVIGLILVLSAWALATYIGKLLGHPLFR